MSANGVYFKAVHIPCSSLSASKKYQIKVGKLSENSVVMSDDDIAVVQPVLEQDIYTVNSHISALNERYFRRSVRWDRNLCLCKQKLWGPKGTKRKVSHTSMLYDNLWDGVHPTPEEACKWYYFLCRSVEVDLQELVVYSLEVASTRVDTWDFKRCRYA